MLRPGPQQLNRMNRKPARSQKALKARPIPAQGSTLGVRNPTNPRPESPLYALLLSIGKINLGATPPVNSIPFQPAPPPAPHRSLLHLKREAIFIPAVPSGLATIRCHIRASSRTCATSSASSRRPKSPKVVIVPSSTGPSATATSCSGNKPIFSRRIAFMPSSSDLSTKS